MVRTQLEASPAAEVNRPPVGTHGSTDLPSHEEWCGRRADGTGDD